MRRGNTMDTLISDYRESNMAVSNGCYILEGWSSFSQYCQSWTTLVEIQLVKKIW